MLCLCGDALTPSEPLIHHLFPTKTLLPHPLGGNHRFRTLPSRTRDRQISLHQLFFNNLPSANCLFFVDHTSLSRVDCDIWDFGVHALHFFGLRELLGLLLDLECFIETL